MIDPQDIPGHRPDNDREQLAALGHSATRRNCWTCRYDSIEEDTGCHLCHALGGLGVVDWVEAHVAGNGDVASMPAHNAPPCPGWEPMAEPATVQDSLMVRPGGAGQEDAMSDDKAYTLPAPDAPAEEWGRLAVSIPGWRWMPGMLAMWSLDDDPPMPLRLTEDASDGHNYTDNPVWSGVRSDREHNDHELDPDWCWPDPDDPATAGCLLTLIQGPVDVSFQSRAWGVTYNVQCSRLTVGMTASGAEWEVRAHGHDPHHNAGWSKPVGTGSTLGRACIAAAAALGRWPGGEG